MKNRRSMTGAACQATASMACAAATLTGTLVGKEAFAADQIFPDAAAQHVSVEYKQDGRTVRGAISNGSSLVATRVEISCLHSAPRPDCDSGKKYKGRYSSLIVTAEDLANPQCRYIPLGTELVVTHEATLLPGKSGNLYAELPAGRVLASCWVKEVRGREKRWFEF